MSPNLIVFILELDLKAGSFLPSLVYFFLLFHESPSPQPNSPPSFQRDLQWHFLNEIVQFREPLHSISSEQGCCICCNDDKTNLFQSVEKKSPK